VTCGDGHIIKLDQNGENAKGILHVGSFIHK